MRRQIDISGLDTIADLLPDFERSLHARNRSPRTVESYVEAACKLDTYLEQNQLPRALRDIRRRHIEDFIADQLARWRPATAAVRFRSLQQFFKWAVIEDELAASPMEGMTPPTVEPDPVAVVGADDVRALLKSCEGKVRTFEDFRDSALLRLFYDTGCRLSEITMLTVAQLDIPSGQIEVLGKGQRWRTVPFGDATRRALRRYLRARDTHPLAHVDWLWLGGRGQQLTPSGIAQMLRRRSRLAGIEELHPHQFRHTAAHNLLAEGMEESDAMRLFGWRSRDMLTRYAASTGEERARDAYRRQGAPGDRL